MAPKKTKITLTAKQLASLDLLITKKKAGAKDFTADVANNLANVAANATVAAVAAGAVGATPAAAITAGIGVAAVATAVATQAVGDDVKANEKAIRDHFNKIGRKMPLKALIELRNMAMVKK